MAASRSIAGSSFQNNTRIHQGDVKYYNILSFPGDAPRNRRRPSKWGPLFSKIGFGIKDSDSRDDLGSAAQLEDLLAHVDVAKPWPILGSDRPDSVGEQIKDNVKARQDLCKWVLGERGERDLNDVYDHCVQGRLNNTCSWILDRPEFKNWLSADFDDGPKVLWIRGAPAFGKTMLCSRVVEHLLSTDTAELTAYYFFSSDFESREDPTVAVRFWLVQLIKRSDQVLDLVRETRFAHDGLAASSETVFQLLRGVLSIAPGCSLVVDGLDECTTASIRWTTTPSGRRYTVQDFLGRVQREMVSAPKPSRLLIVSRDMAEVRDTFAQTRQLNFVHYYISQQDVDADVHALSLSVIEQKLPNKPEVFRKEISQQLAERSEGQFLWVKLKSQDLSGGMNKKRLLEAVRETDEEGRGLARLYERSWQKINELSEKRRKRAVRLLRWVAFAWQPLTIQQISEAVLIEDGGHDDIRFSMQDLPDAYDEQYVETEVLDLCYSLLEVRAQQLDQPDLKTVHFVHFTVKQYLLANTNRPSPTAELCTVDTPGLLHLRNEQIEHSRLARLCLTYINAPLVWRDSVDDPENDVFTKAFRDYAATQWHNHAASGILDDARTHQQIFRLFDAENPCWEPWAEFIELEGSEESSEGGDDSQALGEVSESAVVAKSKVPEPLSLASRLGLLRTALYLINVGKHDVNNQDKQGRTALIEACWLGNVPIVEALLSVEADWALADNDGYTPLLCAASSGHQQVLEILLERGADLAVRNKNGKTALMLSCGAGLDDMVKFLLRKGADLAATDVNGQTPLIRACWGNHQQVAELLLDSGADINLGDVDGWGPLHIASCLGDVYVVKLLIQRGSDVASSMSDGTTALHLAAIYGHHEVVRLLIDNKADIETSDSDGRTPLFWASLYEHIETVEALLGAGARVSAMTTKGRTALMMAANGGYSAVAKLLLANKAEPNLMNSDGMSAMHYAAVSAHTEMMKLLLGVGADLNVKDGDGWAPLHRAVLGGHLDAVVFLLQVGADVCESVSSGETPLHIAARRGHIELVRLFLHKDAKCDAVDNSGWTPLATAAARGHVEVARLLVQNGAGIDQAGYLTLTPVDLAARSGHTEVARLLLESGAGIDKADQLGSTPLHHAAWNGHTEVVRLLLESRAGFDKADHYGETPLHQAAWNGNTEVVRMLLESGAGVDNADRQRRNPLHYAAWKGHTEVVRLLLESGASIDKADQGGETPLHCAARNGNIEVSALLVGKGADIEAGSKLRRTVLHAAAMGGREEMVSLLLGKGAKVDAVELVRDWTPLTYAAGGGHQTIVQLLVDYGADITHADPSGRSALFLAAANGHVAVMEYFLGRGVLFAADRYGASALSMAVRRGHEAAVKKLLSLPEMELESKDIFGRSVLWWAKKQGHGSIADLLVSTAQAAGISLQVSCAVPKPYETESGGLFSCDVCLLYIDEKDRGHRCLECPGSQFDICVDCYGRGARCFDASHDREEQEQEEAQEQKGEQGTETEKGTDEEVAELGSERTSG